MSADCRAFRRDLAEALDVEATTARRALGWHRHLAVCGACREMLEHEEALDELLETLPLPRLPENLVRRVLLRLESERLEALLALDAAPAVPVGLSQRVLAGLSGAREEAEAPARGERALDRVLARLPVPEVPADLAERTLRALVSERTARRAAAGRLRAGRFARRRIAAVAAAAVLVACGLWFRFGRERGPAPAPRDDTLLVDRGAASVDPELLDDLDLLESWDTVTSDDLDLVLAELDAIDIALLEHGDQATEEDGG